MRIFDSEIIIESNSLWYFRGNEIIHENVLDYFKQNLHEDEKGIYIHNTHGELVEKGYVLCKGFPLRIINWLKNEDDALYFLCDNGEQISSNDLHFYYDENETIFCQKKNSKYIKMKFSRGMHNYISDILIEEDKNFYLQMMQGKIPISLYTGQFTVEVPAL